MKKTLISLTMMMMAGSAFAANDGVIKFEGSWIDNPCEVTVNGNLASGSKVSVLLDNWNTANYTVAGMTTEMKPVDITLANCPEFANAHVGLMGVADSTDPTIFKLTADAGVATGVGIGLFETASATSAIRPNSYSMEIPIDPTSRNGQGTFYASYKTTSSTVTAGPANTEVTLDISYN